MSNKNIRSSYDRYKQTTRENVSAKIYVEINNLYNKFLIQKALAGNEVTLPARLGTIYIQGRKSNIRFVDGKITGLPPDWVGTKKLWDSNPEAKAKKTLLYHTNEETDGYRFKWCWSKKNVLVENKAMYTLKMTRENKRSVNHKIKEGKPYKTV